MRIIKRLSFILITAVLVMGLTACGKKKDLVFTLNGKQIDKKSVDVFGLIYVAEHSIVDSSRLNDVYEDGKTYSEYYKSDLEEEIVLSVLLSKEADDKKFSLSKEDKQEAENRADSLIEKLGEDGIKHFGIDRDDIVDVYRLKLHGNSYAASIGEDTGEDNVDSDMVKDAGEDSDDSVKESDGLHVEDRYVKVFQVTFPTVVYDASGMIMTDREGELIRVSSGEMEEMKSAAEDFSEKAKEGEDVEKLLKDEPAAVKGVERVLKYEDISDDYKSELSKIKPGEVSSVIDGEYGYYVVKLLDPEDDEHAELINNYEVQKKTSEAKEKLYTKLFDTYVGADKNYRNDDIWNTVSINDYLY